MEDARTTAARRHFDSWSESYEGERTQRLREVQDAALGELELGPQDVLLDLACGTGAALRTAAPTVARAVGCDLSPGMLAQARARAEGLGNVSFCEANAAEGLPFEEGEFTAAMCTTAFHHFTDQPRVITELARVLAPGGRVLIGDANAAHPLVWVFDRALRVLQRSHVGFRAPARLREDLEAKGFEDVRARTLWHGCYALVRARRRAP
jgi:ubiquinone/menaquinone biosynthesis C-methylase UbiE